MENDVEKGNRQREPRNTWRAVGGRDKLEQSILTHLYENTIRKPISNVKINSHEGRPLDYLLRDEGVISVWFPAV